MKFLQKSISFFLLPLFLVLSLKNKQKTTHHPCKKVKFEEVCKGNYCGITDRKHQVIKTQEEWSKLWEKTFSIQTQNQHFQK